MGDRTAFFYGTLVGKDPAKTLLASKLTIQPAILHDFCRHRVCHEDYPGIIQHNGHSVLGTYVTGLTDGDIFRLDSFEGSQYTREKVEIHVLKSIRKAGDKGATGQMVETETYVFTDGEHNLEKEEWDYEEFRRDKMKNWTTESHEYAEVDAAVAGLHEITEGRGPGLGGDYDVVEKSDETRFAV